MKTAPWPPALDFEWLFAPCKTVRVLSPGAPASLPALAASTPQGNGVGRPCASVAVAVRSRTSGLPVVELGKSRRTAMPWVGADRSVGMATRMSSRRPDSDGCIVRPLTPAGPGGIRVPVSEPARIPRR